MRGSLTDQGAVAVAIARRAGGAHGNVAHLLLGLAVEPDGLAGHVLRAYPTAVARLSDRVDLAPPRLPEIGIATRWTVQDVQSRPAATTDLLRAALEVGGSDGADFASSCGFPVSDLTPPPLDASLWVGFTETWSLLTETYGLEQHTDDMTAAAARAVARARAAGGEVAVLLLALGLEHDTNPEEVPFSSDDLVGPVWRLRARGVDAEPRPDLDWDADLDEVVAAARSWRAGERVTGLDLARAVAMVGGTGPAALLREACGGGDERAWTP